MSRTQAHVGNPLGKFFTTPFEAALRGRQDALSLGRPDLVPMMVELALLTDERLKTYFGEAEARKVYATVRDKGTFGTWECKYEQRQRKPWRVDVLPIAYAPPRDPQDLLTNHRMIIEVTPYQQ